MMATQPEPLLVSSKDIDRAEEYKGIANKHFSAGDMDKAIEYYTQAISYNPRVAAYFSNRSIGTTGTRAADDVANFKLELYGAALADASEAIKIDPKFVKGYYRRASANMALGRLKEAIKDFKAVTTVAPSDPTAKAKLAACQKEHRRIEFEKAIFVEQVKVSAVELLGDVASIIVEDSYMGPHLGEDGITMDFVTALLQWMKEKKLLHKKYTYQLLIRAKEFFDARPTIEDVVIPDNAKLTVCGDIHGQYYDLLHIFERNGIPSPTNMYLFNGDFVDRGSFSVECILTLFAFKLLYPTSLYLSRGNHETDDMNRVYGFEGEVKAKYTDATFKLFSEIFNAIPLGNLIMDKILVIHGGLFSRDGPGNSGLMCELLWSDPQLLPGRSPSKRGVAIQFGPDVTSNFCETNNLKMIIRSHEVKHDGYEVAHNGQCVTIFSAPN
ncbi:Serine/threonine-protein phosphatase 5 [Kappamyces sp. JEL0680]|nr:Serine/threonine-protein phosphatase 5 [Kappamyces sp. JEL0680]